MGLEAGAFTPPASPEPHVPLVYIEGLLVRIKIVASLSKLVSYAMLCSTFYVCYVILLLTTALKGGTLIISSLQMGTRRLRGVQYLIKDRSVSL